MIEWNAIAPSRLDQCVSEQLQSPRNPVEQLIKKHGVRVNGVLIYKPGFKLKGGEHIGVEPQEATPSPEGYPVEFDIPILYEDEHLLVINKPPFITVHGAPSVKEATVVDWLHVKGISLSTLSGEERHGIVHRIDKETSGALVIAKSNAVHAHLSEQLSTKAMGRYYLALIDLPLKEETVVTIPLGRQAHNRLVMGYDKEGREAKSAFAKLAPSKNGKTELIAAKLFTGRTHQIRAHLAALSRHILGDSLYGFKSDHGTIPRVMLHAYVLYLIHPITRETMLFEAPLMEDFETLLAQLFDKDALYETITPRTIMARFDTVDQWLRRGT